MGVFDKFLNAIRINDDDYEDDEFYDEDDVEEEAPAAPKPRRKLFSRHSKNEKDDYLDDDDDFEEPAARPKQAAAPRQTSVPRQSTITRQTAAPHMTETPKPFTATPASSASFKQPVKNNTTKVTPIRKKNGSPMEVFVIKPVSMEDTREIADTLLSGCTVVLNLEGIDVELAQRVIDFTSGSCYSIDGSLQKVSSYIFILTPANVEISGDITDILGGTAFSYSNIR